MIRNESRKTVIGEEYKFAQNFLDKAFGLLLQSNPRVLFFETRLGIHTFFMRDKIDVVILDNHNRVVDLKINLAPNRIFVWDPKFSLVLELPSGTIIKSKTEIGDIISFPRQKQKK